MRAQADAPCGGRNVRPRRFVPARTPRFCRAAPIACVALAGCLQICCSAQNATGSRPVVAVAEITDAGGLGTGADGRRLNVRFTEAVRSTLESKSGGRFILTDPPAPGDTSGTAPQMIVEGDLSHIASTARDGGAYVCALRLYLAGKPRVLLADWVAEADTLRYLTGNLSDNRGVDPQGAVAELCDRLIVAILGGESAVDRDTLGALVAKSASVSHLNVTLQQDAASTPGQVPAGQPYRLNIDSGDPGVVYVLGIDPDGATREIVAPDAGHQSVIAPGHPVLVPESSPLVADSTTVPVDRDYIVLVHRTVSDSAMPASDLSMDPSVPVKLIGRGPTDPSPDDPAVASLCSAISNAPEGSWLATRVAVHIVPAPPAPTVPPAPAPAVK
ncbi:MAG: hypothetical protein ACLQVD_03970 [Capsulimonadaceae bacterium]